MKNDHYAKVFSLAAVVRRVVEDVAAHRTVPREARAALAAVDAWLGGKPVDAAALQAAADLSFQEGVPFARREKDRALGWLRTAAGNLAWLAKKDRGWQNGGQPLMDAAFYALSSLGIPGLPDDKALEALRAAALAKAPASTVAEKKAPPKAKPVDLSAHIGAAANKRLKKRSPVFDPAARGGEPQLRALLAEKKYAIHDAVLAYDARYGGLVAADAPGEEGQDWIFGAYACLRSDAHKDPRGGKADRVPIAYSPNDVIYFIDGKGVVWAIDTIEDERDARFADDADAMMTRIFTED